MSVDIDGSGYCPIDTILLYIALIFCNFFCKDSNNSLFLATFAKKISVFMQKEK